MTTTTEDGYTVIGIKDNGLGIPPDKHELIFSKYHRLENGVQGTGIGLYLVRKIIQTAGGKVTLEKIWAKVRCLAFFSNPHSAVPRLFKIKPPRQESFVTAASLRMFQSEQ